MLLTFKQNKIKQKGLDSTEQLKHKQPCLKGLTEYKILGANNKQKIPQLGKKNNSRCEEIT